MKITRHNFIKYFKKGKEEALEYIIDEYIGIIKAIIYNSLKGFQDEQIIEECISDTFLGAFDNAKQFKGDEEDFRKWLCTIAKFKAIDSKRKLLRDPTIHEINDTHFLASSAEEEFFLKESTNELLKKMNQLNQIDQDIFIMKYFLDMKNSDIATQLGMSKSAVDNRLYRGKKQLQQLFLGGNLL
ncbi:sigma-70 family RNA polymerase sigma factor [Bacillaceae bacterium W0354]